MPLLLWVTFWSTIIGTAACFGDVTALSRRIARNEMAHIELRVNEC
jgi:hypothetical protein